jgi:hypothetical protein
VNTKKSNSPEPLLVSEKEAARLLGVSVAMLVANRFRGQPLLPFVRLGKRAIRYRLADIEALIGQKTVAGSPDMAKANVVSLPQRAK